MRLLPLSPLLLAALLAAGCKKNPPPPPPTQASATAAASSSAPARARLPSPRRTGSALARTVAGDLLLVADEDHNALRRVPLPLDQQSNEATDLPGPPAQVLVRDGEVWVTVRDPGLLLGFAIEGKELRQIARIAVPADAWGMGLSPDESRMLVTSPWSNAVTLVDLATHAVVKTISVAREPRAAVFAPDGKRAYLTHLTGTALTRVDLTDGGLEAKVVQLPASPLRAPFGAPAGASLAYSATLSPDGKRLFVARHALGTYLPIARGPWGSEPTAVWFGNAALDVLLLGNDEALAPRRTYPGYVGNFGRVMGLPEEAPRTSRPPSSDPTPFVQPRDVVYRSKTRSLLVVSEGTDELTEHDALSLDPTLGTMRHYRLGDRRDGATGVSTAGAVPQGVALSEDEKTAWIFARGTYELVQVPLSEVPGVHGAGSGGGVVYVRLGEDPLGPEASLGRRVFFNAADSTVSGGLACAGCHPEGRDDGFVWHEAREKRPDSGNQEKKPDSGSQEKKPEKPLPAVFVGHPLALEDAEDEGHARQTPMLAGRVDAEGPYGWHAQSKNLEARVAEGFLLHRWTGRDANPKEAEGRIRVLAEFLRKGGLRPPPREQRELTDEETKGKEIFTSDKTACASCHPPDSAYTNRTALPLKAPLPARAGFAADTDVAFKVPSLLFLKNTAPYYHDGSASSLEELIDKNADRMGQTSHLNAAEKKALVAFLRTL